MLNSNQLGILKSLTFWVEQLEREYPKIKSDSDRIDVSIHMMRLSHRLDALNSKKQK